MLKLIGKSHKFSVLEAQTKENEKCVHAKEKCESEIGN
jgi:hypothetical protein